MALRIDARRLKRQLSGKYGAYEDHGGDHPRYYWVIDNQEFSGVKVSHGARGTLEPFIASSIVRKLGLKNTAELKEVERCNFNVDELLRCIQAAGTSSQT